MNQHQRAWPIAAIAPAGVVIAGFALRHLLTTANLPVAVGVDERTGLWLLHRFSTGQWNPEWFQYPTFYYYFTYFALAPFPFEHILYNARVLNLLLGCATAVAAAVLAYQIYPHPIPPLIAAALTVFSPILITAGSYINTDVLTTLLSVCALAFLVAFIRTARAWYWLAGVVLMGLAISSKYTAAIVLVSWTAIELAGLAPPFADRRQLLRRLNSGLPPRVVVAMFVVAGTGALAVGFTFPLDALMAVLESAGGLDAVVEPSDVTFLTSLRTYLFAAAIVFLGIAAAAWRSEMVAKRLGHIRLHAAVLLAVGVFFLASPGALFSPADFLYDVGVELKANASAEDDAQWIRHVERYTERESLIALALCIVGAVAMRRGALIAVVYLLVGYVALGAARRGYDHYWTIQLPVVFALAGGGLLHTVRLFGSRRVAPWLLATGLIAAAAYEQVPKVVQSIRQGLVHDPAYRAFGFVNALQPSLVLYSGASVPSFEWMLGGIETRAVPRAVFGEPTADFLVSDTPTDAVVVINGDAEEMLSREVRQHLTPLWSDRTHSSRYSMLFVYRPVSVPATPDKEH